jgi:hypothetical protein
MKSKRGTHIVQVRNEAGLLLYSMEFAVQGIEETRKSVEYYFTIIIEAPVPPYTLRKIR